MTGPHAADWHDITRYVRPARERIPAEQIHRPPPRRCRICQQPAPAAHITHHACRTETSR